jgi:hypothetical protein
MKSDDYKKNEKLIILVVTYTQISHLKGPWYLNYRNIFNTKKILVVG